MRFQAGSHGERILQAVGFLWGDIREGKMEDVNSSSGLRAQALYPGLQKSPRLEESAHRGYPCLLLAACVALALVTCGFHSMGAQSPNEELYRGFLDPPRKYSPMPFWFWNGKMEGPRIQEQIREMVKQHVYGAFLHGRDGLETPYLSEAWWQAIGAGLEEARRAGFSFNFVDEYNWPSGEVRNIWMTSHHQSEVLARNADFRMKSLRYKAEVVKGPKAVDFLTPQELQAVVAARWLGNNRIDERSLQDLTSLVEGKQFKWSAPEGDWILVSFSLEPSMGFDGGFVDLMSPEAMKLFFDLSYGEFHRRFGSYFGNTIQYSFADHEGDYGNRIAWTPRLFGEFARRMGYDLRKVLPLLIYDGGDLSIKARCDYLETVTQIYQEVFWQGITSWAEAFHIGRTGHGWEETLQFGAALEGSLFSVQRGLNPVGVDSLFDAGRQALSFKVAQSVADFENRRFVCENQGVQGTDSYLDMESLRRGTNGIGTWGVDLFVPHAFNYDTSKANYPPDWLHQPYWPHFHHYADYVRRISYMNGESRHVAPVLLYYPMTSVWAYSDPVFSGRIDYRQVSQPAAWRNVTTLINDYYAQLTLKLVDRQWDYDIADDYYLAKAKIEGKELVIGPQRFKAIVLPPLTTLRRSTLKTLINFYQAGGTIFGIRLLPKSSPETGGNDREIKEGVAKIFGANAHNVVRAYSEQQSPGGGKAYFIASETETLIDLLDAHLRKDARVIEGPEPSLFYQHREKQGLPYYWMVNDTDRPRVNRILFSQSGVPEKWDALTGERSPLFYVNRPEGTEVRLSFAPWDAYYVVFRTLSGAPQEAELVATNAESLDVVSRDAQSIRVHVSAPATSNGIRVALRHDGRTYQGQTLTTALKPIALEGDWEFRPQPQGLGVPYAKVMDSDKEGGVERGWTQAGFDDTEWSLLWLSESQNTLRNWNIIGPFPNEDDAGFTQVLPPEKSFDPDQEYPGVNGERIGWKRYFGDVPDLGFGKWNTWMEIKGGPFDDAAHIVQFNRILPTSDKTWIVSYALCYLYSQREQKAQFILAADNNARLWLNQKLVFERLRHPFWYELNESWADRVPVELQPGWNQVLLKVGLGRHAASGFYGFTFRVADLTGRTLPDIKSSLAPSDMDASITSDGKFRWYRVDVPPGCVAVMPPALRGSYRLFFNSHELAHSSNGPLDFRKLLKADKNVLVIAAPEDDRLSTPVEFITGFTHFVLRPWTATGLVNFSGTGIYEKEFVVSEPYRGKRLVLDCGRVSSVAEVFVNGEKAGTAVWRPFRFDITRLVKPGRNQLRILVTNTEANQRAVGTNRKILEKIDKDGLEGPVEIIPYVDETLVCTTTPGK